MNNKKAKRHKKMRDNRGQALDDKNYKLPKDTRETIDADNLNKIENYALRLNKMAYFDRGKGKFIFYEQDKKQKSILNVKPNFSKIELDKILERQKMFVTKSRLETKSFQVKTDWRLVVGLGHESVYETAITLHYTYGFPFLPASAIKGMTRNYIIITKFNMNEENALKDDVFINIFGQQEQEGKIVFFDAFPKSPSIEVDIMNPHYSEYYSDSKNQKMPADYYSPKPINFLTVKNTEFNVYLAVKREDNLKIQQVSKNDSRLKNEYKENTLLDLAVKWTKEAFCKHGIGAKTAVGYGFLKNV